MGNQVSHLYRRPAHMDDAALAADRTARAGSGGVSVGSGSTGRTAGIPPALTFEKIISGGTCPPCTIRDFMNFLLYVEHSAENLQFYLWHREYEKRFAAAPESGRRLAEEWTRTHVDEVFLRMRREAAEKRQQRADGGVAAEMFRGTDFEKRGGGGRRHPGPQLFPPVGSYDNRLPLGSPNPFATPPGTPVGGGDGVADRESTYTHSAPPTTAAAAQGQAGEAFAAAGATIPFTIQPFREEIDRVVATYVAEGAPRQLNLSAAERRATLLALSHTTHPSAFRLALETVDASLRCQAHPNFIRWSICNGNPSRVRFARGLGVFLVAASLVVAVGLSLSGVPRGYRAVPAAGWLPGIATLIAAWKGMCVVLHGMHHRQVRPWELFVDAEEGAAGGSGNARDKKSFDSLGSGNSYEDEPWVVRYRKRNVVRKIFDRETWIEEPALRQIQDKIFVQSLAIALVVGGVLAVVFVFVPGGDFF